MWNSEGKPLASVLIVENPSGDLYIVENKKSKSTVENILSDAPKSKRRKREVEAVELKDEIKEEYLYDEEIIEKDIIKSDYDEDEPETIHEFDEMPRNFCFLDPDGVEIKVEEDYKLQDESDSPTHEQLEEFNEFDNYSDDQVEESYSTDDEKPLSKIKKKVIVKKFEPKLESLETRKNQSHKSLKLTGKNACKYCVTIFKSNEERAEHDCEFLKCDPKNFICRVCRKELSRNTFSNHLHETLGCKFCGSQFVNPRNLKSHIRRKHADGKMVVKLKYTTEETGIPGIVKEELLEDGEKVKKKYKRKKGAFECDLCGKILCTVKSLESHLMLHSNTQRYICHKCGSRFTTNTGMARHSCEKKRKKPLVDFRTYNLRYCKYCDVTFTSLAENEKHTCPNLLPDPKCFRCRFCQRDFSKHSYNKHMSKHSDTKWVCHICNRELADERALNLHISIHTGNKPFKCPDCPESFINKHLLQRHSRFHGHECPVYKCEICNKELSSKHFIKVHMRIHKDTVTCQICKGEFLSKEDLREHYQQSHLPYTCEICSRNFALERYLKMHMKLHDPDVKIQCDYCEKSFTKKGLQNHIYKHHQDSFVQVAD